MDVLKSIILPYVLPLMPTALLVVSKIYKSKKLMNFSLISGLLPLAYIVFILIKSTSLNGYVIINILLLCIPWLLIRIPAYFVCKIKDESFERENSFLRTMITLDTVFLFVSVIEFKLLFKD